MSSTIAACGGDEQSNLTLQEYFTQVESVLENAGRRIDAIVARYDATPSDDGSFSDAERISRGREQINELMLVAGDVVGDLSEINPPSEAKDAHNAYTDSLEEQGKLMVAMVASEAFEEFVLGIANASSPDEFRQITEAFQEPEFIAATERYDEACDDLEEIAAANAIEVEGSLC